MSKSFRLGVAGLLVAAVLALSPAAFAAHGAPARTQGLAGVTSGKCSTSSTWRLTLKYDNGRVESDWEVQSNAPGQLWKYKMTDNGVKFASGQKTSLGDGSWSVTRFATNQPGPDTITVTSKNTVTGEICSGSGTL